jgi:hypothetical protein
MLDMFADDYAQAAQPQANEGRDLPPTFGESFQDAWENGQLATSGIKQDNARAEAINEYIDKIKAAGGDIDAEYAKQAAEAGSYGEDQLGNTVQPDPLEVANGVVARMKASADTAGKQLPFQPMTSGDIDQRAAQISGQAITDNAAMQARPQTWGSRIGSFLGGAASATAEPYNIPLMAIPVEGLGIIGTAAAFGAATAATQAANEAVNAPFNERVQPGYAASGQAFSNIAEAGAGGALLGGGVKIAGNVLTRLLTGAWPTAAKDAANGIMSEADILNSNRLPGAEGEAAHNDALAKSIGQVLREDPVDVSAHIPDDSAFADRVGDLPTEAAPPQEPNTVRLYERPAEGEAPAQLTPSAAEAPADARFVDIPADHPEIAGENAPGIDAATGAYRPFEPSEDLASQLRPVQNAPITERAAEEARPGSLTSDQIREQIAAPETANAVRADVERAIDEAAQGGKALQSPTGLAWTGGFDKRGQPILEPVFGNVADQLAEVDAMRQAADLIAQCAAPMAMAAE